MQFCFNSRSQAGFIVSGLLLALSGPQAFAAGFAIRAQSASSIGTAGASDVAGTADISAMFSNPAALSAFKGQNLSIGGAYIMPNAKFSNGVRTVGSLGVEAGTDADETKESDDFANNSFIPAFYGTYEVNEDIVAGVSLTAPFGTNSDYGKDWVGRYQGTKTELEIINLDLAASYKVMDDLKLGFGVQVQRGRGLIEGASNFGAAYYRKVATAQAQAGVPLVSAYYAAASDFQADPTNPTKGAAFQAAGAAVEANAAAKFLKAATDSAIKDQPAANVPDIIKRTLTDSAPLYVVDQITKNEGQDDIYAEYEGNDISYGFTFGILYNAMPDLDLGFSYRSQVVHKTEGDYTVTAETAAAQAEVDNSIGGKHDAKLNLAVPDIIGFGAAYKGVPDTNIYASASLTRWSKIEDINVRPATASNVQVILNWEDVWHVGVGADYKIDSNVTIRAGVASDNSPTTDDLRSPRSPDDNRKFFSLGGRYETETWGVDAGLLHSQFRDPTLALKNDAYPKADGRGDLKGDYKVSANTFMAQYNMKL